MIRKQGERRKERINTSESVNTKSSLDVSAKDKVVHRTKEMIGDDKRTKDVLLRVDLMFWRERCG